VSDRASVRAKERDRRRRRKLEAALAKKGVAPEVIADVVAEIQRKQADHRAAELRNERTEPRKQVAQGRVVALTEEERARLDAAQARFWENQPDDKGYRPKRIDPLTQGDARASGAAALAVRRGKTLTKWEYDQMEARGVCV
jgi:hypothetical protein